jgi:hypothetical protein
MVCALMMVGLLCWAVVFDAGRIAGRPTPDNPSGAGRSGAQGARDDLGSCAEVRHGAVEPVGVGLVE